ncbi:MAG: hypothetical protein E7330_07335 [Clostridiales bacterium]|nr:hypothetical protein [Clostridiales bacterium]
MFADHAAPAHIMTEDTMDAFVSYETERGASANMARRLSCAIKAFYGFLPADKQVTKERLLVWRKSLEESGYASMTVQNYAKYINRYLSYAGCDALCFNRGRAKDIAGMVFGHLTAIEPAGTKNRRDIVWRCSCSCGNAAEVTAARLLSGNTLSCGCLQKEHLQRVNRYIDNTSLRQSLTEQVESTRSQSGYTGVMSRRGKWQAYINYKGRRHSLGTYSVLEDAVKARAKGKALVRADAEGLLDFYEELHKLDPQLPSRESEGKKKFPPPETRKNVSPAPRAKRGDNKSGYTGVSLIRGRYEARICHRGVRYILGRYDRTEDAIEARIRAEEDLRKDPDGFAARYRESCRHHDIGKK